jgi:hypothetical protein
MWVCAVDRECGVFAVKNTNRQFLRGGQVGGRCLGRCMMPSGRRWPCCDSTIVLEITVLGPRPPSKLGLPVVTEALLDLLLCAAGAK